MMMTLDEIGESVLMAGGLLFTQGRPPIAAYGTVKNDVVLIEGKHTNGSWHSRAKHPQRLRRNAVAS
jgi:hypothetical protein